MNDQAPTLVEYATPGGLTLRGEVAGPEGAPTVVLMHGGGQTRHSWDNERRLLVADGYRVVNYDARGHGDSDWSPDADYSVQALAADLQLILDTLSGPVALVGASMGGMTGFYAAGTSAGQAKALVMVDVAPKMESSGTARIVNFMNANPDGFATLDEAADAVAAYNPHRPRPKNPSGLMNNLRRRENGRLYWHWDPRLIRQRVSPEPPAFQGLAPTIAPNVHIPVLLVRGAKSELINDASVTDFQAMLPHLEVVNVAGAGHMVAGDDNSLFHAGIIGFLKRNLPLG